MERFDWEAKYDVPGALPNVLGRRNSEAKQKWAQANWELIKSDAWLKVTTAKPQERTYVAALKNTLLRFWKQEEKSSARSGSTCKLCGSAETTLTTGLCALCYGDNLPSLVSDRIGRKMPEA